MSALRNPVFWLLALFVIILLVPLPFVPASAAGSGTGAGEPARGRRESDIRQKNLFILTSAEDFLRGVHEGTEVVGHDERGAVALKKGVSRGTYTSQEVPTEPLE